MHPRTCMVVGLLKNCNALVSLLLGSFGACVCVHRWGLMYLCELVKASVSYLYLTFCFRFWGRVSHWIWSTLFWLLWLASSQGIPIAASYMLNLPMGRSPCLPDFYVGLGYWTWVLTLLWQGLYPIEPSLLYLSFCFIEGQGKLLSLTQLCMWISQSRALKSPCIHSVWVLPFTGKRLWAGEVTCPYSHSELAKMGQDHRFSWAGVPFPSYCGSSVGWFLAH